MPKPSWQIITAEWEDVIGCLGQFDHTIGDPPYSEKTHKKGAVLTTGKRKAPLVVDLGFGHLESTDICHPLLDASSRWVILFCSLEQLGAYEKSSGDRWVRAGIWNRTMSMPQVTGDRPGQGAEGLAIMHRKGKKRWNGGGRRGVWTCNVEHRERFHETPKPPKLMMELIRDFTDPGDLVLDPYCGSGTTGVACIRLGRRFIGVERSPEHAATARARLAAECRNTTLTSDRAGQASLF